MSLKNNLQTFGIVAYNPVWYHYSMANMLIFLYEKIRTSIALILNISTEERGIELILAPL